MSKNIQRATMENIGGGIAPVLFQAGMERIMDNIADGRTSAIKGRTLTITFTIKADETRAETTVDVAMKTTLAQIGSKKAVTYLTKNEDGETVMAVSNPKQMELADQLAAVNED